MRHCKPRTRARSERASTRAHHTERSPLTARHSAHGTIRVRWCAPTAGAWAEHKSSFDSNFFRDFKTSPEGFQYKFVADGEGERPERLQKVFVDCAPLPL